MNRENLKKIIFEKKSVLCVGLDSDINKIPQHLLSCEYPQFEFNKEIINATINYAVAYKINTAFYESNGINGWLSIKKTLDYIKSLNKEVFLIADAKRGDIGNTSLHYAKAFFDEKNSGFNFDAITVNPYMGEDSIKPFLDYKNKWIIVLALTSNDGAADFQLLKTYKEPDEKHKYLYQNILEKFKKYDNIMFVVGATKASMLKEIRKIVPENFLLIPGVGAQGGDLEEVLKYGLNNDGGLLINVSRSIIFASQGTDFAVVARNEAEKICMIMKKYLE